MEGRAAQGPAVDSARGNLAATFVNAFVNAGFGTDKLLMAEGADAPAGGESVTWIYKNKDDGKMSATASLGCILMWDVDGGLPQIDKRVARPESHPPLRSSVPLRSSAPLPSSVPCIGPFECRGCGLGNQAFPWAHMCT